MMLKFITLDVRYQLDEAALNVQELGQDIQDALDKHEMTLLKIRVSESVGRDTTNEAPFRRKDEANDLDHSGG